MREVDARVEDAHHDRGAAGRDVPGLVGVDVRIGRAGDALHGLAGVHETPELPEGGVVRGRERMDLVVGLREPDAGIAAEASEHGVQPGWIDSGELRRNVPQLAVSLCARRCEKLLAFGVRDAGGQSDDELRGRARRAGRVERRLALGPAGEEHGRRGYDKQCPYQPGLPDRSAGGVADQPTLLRCSSDSRPDSRT